VNYELFNILHVVGFNIMSSYEVQCWILLRFGCKLLFTLCWYMWPPSCYHVSLSFTLSRFYAVINYFYYE